MAKRGPKLKGPTTDDHWAEFDNLCEFQCTMAEISAWFDCDPDTLQRRVQERFGRNFSVVFKEKRKKGFVSLRRAQMQAALMGDTTMLIFLGKKYLGQAELKDLLSAFKD